MLITNSEKNKESMVGFLHNSDFKNVTAVNSGSQARRLLSQKEYAVCIIDTPLSDEFGHELAIFVVQKFSCGSIIIVKNDIEDDISSKLEDYGIIVISKPLNPQLLYKMIKLSITSCKRIFDINSENIKLHIKLEEMKIIDRAKCTLIEKLKMTETQAHRYIEKQAMDLRITKKIVSENILKTYET